MRKNALLLFLLLAAFATTTAWASHSIGPAPDSSTTSQYSCGMKPSRSPGDAALAHDMTSGYGASEFMTFQLPDLSSRTILTSNQPVFLAMDMSRNGGMVYAVDASNILYQITPGDGSWAPLGNILGLEGNPGLETVTGLSFPPYFGQPYLCTSDNTESWLYTLNMTTGQATSIGRIGTGRIIIDIAISVENILYGLDIVTDTLCRIDRSTAGITELGSLGLNINYTQGMDFDFSDNLLYAALYNNDTSLTDFSTINLETGSATVHSSVAGEYEVAIPIAAPLSSTPAPALGPWGGLILALGLLASLFWVRKKIVEE